jgi:hypothetical protein
MKARICIVLMIFGLVAALTGCAGSKIYLMEVKYLAEQKAAPGTRVVGICPFEDMREAKEKDVIGVRHRGGKYVDLMKLEGVSLSETVTQAIRDYFIDNGFQVTDCKGWDQTPEGLDRLPRDLTLVVGGKIDSLMVEAKSGVTITNLNYNVKVRGLIGKIKERKVVTRTIESTPKEKKVGFDPEYVQGKLDSILTEVIQKLLEECLAYE